MWGHLRWISFTGWCQAPYKCTNTTTNGQHWSVKWAVLDKSVLSKSPSYIILQQNVFTGQLTARNSPTQTQEVQGLDLPKANWLEHDLFGHNASLLPISVPGAVDNECQGISRQNTEVQVNQYKPTHTNIHLLLFLCDRNWCLNLFHSLWHHVSLEGVEPTFVLAQKIHYTRKTSSFTSPGQRQQTFLK